MVAKKHLFTASLTGSGGVVITAPDNNASVTSPVHISAFVTSAFTGPVRTMQVLRDNTLVYQGAGAVEEDLKASYGTLLNLPEINPDRRDEQSRKFTAERDQHKELQKRERESGELERRQRRMKIREYLLERYLRTRTYDLANLHGDLTITNGFKVSMEVLFAEIEEVLADTCVEAVAGFRLSLTEFRARQAELERRRPQRA